ncbi:50S ribosomal protein L10 [Candidatus Woesearchaeota archaeon]|nr:50S ribosomal protein L10 [Candidatus Woesearchaeota archaeon]
MAHISKEKKQAVAQLVELMQNNPIVGAVNMENLPAKQLQIMRETLREKVTIRMAKRRLIQVALDQSSMKGKDKLVEYLKGMPALLFTKENPFTLFKILKKNKSKGPIKGGQTAPNDIIVKAGSTEFSPGPIIGELGAFRIKTGVENGKVAIKEDCVACKEGEVVDPKLAALLTRLKIFPVDIGLDLVAVLEEGEIIPKSVLDVDEDAYLANLRSAASDSLNLAVFVGFPTRKSTQLLLGKAAREARALAVSEGILTDETVGDVLSKAEAEASALKEKVKL